MLLYQMSQSSIKSWQKLSILIEVISLSLKKKTILNVANMLKCKYANMKICLICKYANMQRGLPCDLMWPYIAPCVLEERQERGPSHQIHNYHEKSPSSLSANHN